MENAYFDGSDLSILLSPHKLRLISSRLSDIISVQPDKKYLEWLNKNRSKHQHREVMLVLSGDSCFTLNGITYSCRPGTVFLIDSESEHDSYYPPFVKNIKHLWFHVVNKTIFTGTPYLKADGERKNLKDFNYVFNEYNYTGLAFIKAWDDLSSNLHLDDEFRSLCVKQAFTGLLLELCRAGYDKLLKPKTQPTEHHHKVVIDAIAKHIQETGGKSLDIARLAYIAGYSKFHFAKIFKNITGKSVLAFINLCRMDKYKELSGKGFNKKQISAELGFSCPAAFSRWLKNTMLEGE